MRSSTLLALLAAGCTGSWQADQHRETQADAAAMAGDRSLDRKDYAQAVEHYSRAIQLAPEFPRPYARRARAYEDSGDLAAAEADYGKAIELAPEEWKAVYYYHRARFAQRQKRLPGAVEDFTRAAELQEAQPNPDYYLITYLHRGLAFLDLGRLDEAIRDFDHVLARNPDPTTRQETEDLRRQAALKKGQK
jgi:tetratricopeptide (TPR) repeat protein